MRKPISIFTVFFFLVFLPVAAQNLEVHIINVGQGDSILIKSPSGTTCLIDAGETGFGTSAVLPYLSNLNISALNYVVASHYHRDHIGGMDEVINGLSGTPKISEAAYDSGGSYGKTHSDEYETAVGDERETISPGDEIDLGDDVKLLCIAANGYIPGQQISSGSNENGKSIVLILKYKCFEMYLGGDIIDSVEDDLAPLAGDVDIYKVSHHGSSTSSDDDLLDVIMPEVSIICVGDGNDHGHPTQDALDRLVCHNSYIYQTETGDRSPAAENGEVVDGDITILTNGYAYVISGPNIPTKILLTDEMAALVNAIIN